ncbi:MAG: distal tail protein Dit [Lachnospiraceae bacterium]
MNYSVRFNGIELGNYIDILQGFTPFSGAAWAPEFKTIGSAKGAKFSLTRYGSKTIPMPFTITGDIRGKYDKLQMALNVDEPKELIFEGVPHRIFYAIPSGDLDFDDAECIGEGTITWIVPDGLAHSEFTMSANNEGASTFTLANNGIETVPVNVAATMKSDNGYIGFTLGDRFYQVGDPGEVDGEQYTTTDLLFDDHMTQDRGWLLNQGITPPVTDERLQVGSVQYVVEVAGEGTAGEGYVEPVTYGAGNSWHGPALTKFVPADKNGEYPTNWYSSYRFDFNTDGGSNKGTQAGHHSVTYSDQNGNIIVSVVFEDNNYSLERSDMVIYVGNKRIWDTKETTSFYVRGHEGRPGSSAIVIVEKIGAQVNIKFSFAGINKSFYVDDASAQLQKVTYYSAQYKAYTPIQNNLLRAIQVRKHNVDSYKNIPNYFMSGDTVELYGDKNELYINGVKDWDKVDSGCKPLLFPPGVHTFGIAVSEFAEIPDVEVSWKERYL